MKLILTGNVYATMNVTTPGTIALDLTQNVGLVIVHHEEFISVVANGKQTLFETGSLSYALEPIATDRFDDIVKLNHDESEPLGTGTVIDFTESVQTLQPTDPINFYGQADVYTIDTDKIETIKDVRSVIALLNVQFTKNLKMPFPEHLIKPVD